MTAAARPGSAGGSRGPERLAILGGTGGIGGHLPPGLTKIARADVAQFMITVLTTDGYRHQAPAICW